MATKLEGLNIPSTIVPYTEEDVYATHDSKFGKGGWRSVETISELNAIPVERRTIGMIVYVNQTKQTFILNGRLDNMGWCDYADQIDKHFSYTDHILIPSDRWEVHHGLNKKPSIQTFNSKGEKIDGFITVVDLNNVIIEFTRPICGTAEFN